MLQTSPGVIVSKLVGNVRVENVGSIWQSNNFCRRPIPDERHGSRALIAKPEALIEVVVRVVVYH